MNSGKYRLQVWYAGRVQGVGFRYKTVQVASGYDVSGYVENLDDGRVRLVAVGSKEEVRAFADKLADIMRDFIRSYDEREDLTEEKYSGFQIRL